MYIDLLFGRIGGVGEQRPETGQHTYPTDRPNKSDTGNEGNREKNGFSVRLPNRGYTDIRSRNIDVGAENSSPNTSRSDEHTSELQPLMRISYAVLSLLKQTTRLYNKS